MGKENDHDGLDILRRGIRCVGFISESRPMIRYELNRNLFQQVRIILLKFKIIQNIKRR